MLGKVVLVSALKFYKCDSRMIDVMVDIYTGDSTEIWRYGEVLGETEVKSGIRQGCTGSPQLFVMVVKDIINSILDSGMCYRDEEFYVPALFYADDGLLLARSCAEAERCVLSINRGVPIERVGNYNLNLQLCK